MVSVFPSGESAHAGHPAIRLHFTDDQRIAFHTCDHGGLLNPGSRIIGVGLTIQQEFVYGALRLGDMQADGVSRHPSLRDGVWIDKNDILYATDSESSVRNQNEYIRGVHIGSAKTGEVTAFLQDSLGNPAPWNPLRGTTGAEGIVVDKDGIVYVSQVTPPALARYTKKNQEIEP